MMSRPASIPHRPTIGILPGWPAHDSSRPDYYLVSVLKGIQSAARRRGCNLLVAWGIGRGFDQAEPVPAWPALSIDTDFVPVGPWNTDGLIVFAPLTNPNRSSYIQTLIGEGHPVLFIAGGEPGPCIHADNETGIRQAVAHLASHQHTRIAFIAGDAQDKGDSEQRLTAYLAAVSECGLQQESSLVAFGNHNAADAYLAVNRLLAEGVKFTALMASDDNSAIGSVQALQDAGLRVPQDVAVIGFDDQPDAVAQVPPLASVHVPLADLGQRAVEMMLDHLETRSPLEPACIPTWLVQRQSCGCLPKSVVSAADSQPLVITTPVDLSEPANQKEKLLHQLAQLMFAALPGGSFRLNRREARQLCSLLARAFLQSLEGGESSHFEAALVESLHIVEAADDEIHIWQEVLSVLRRGMTQLPLKWNEPETRRLAEDMLHEARVLLSEASRRRIHRSKYLRTSIDFSISELNARLSATTDEQTAVTLLNEYLPRLGIQHTRVGLFEAERDDPVAWSVVIKPDGATLPERHRFPSRRFPPPGLYPADLVLSLALIPLVFQGEPLGYLALEAADMEPCPAIARQLTAALKSARLHTQIVDLSLTDALTSLHNRRYFDLFLQSEIDRSRRFQRGLAVMMLDLDHFKSYNDAFGHPAGDEALKAVASCLRENRRSADVVARLGGDEFAVILPETDVSGALEVARLIGAAVARTGGLKRQVTISIGISELRDPAASVRTLMEEADQALYEAKRMGRNRACIYEDHE